MALLNATFAIAFFHFLFDLLFLFLLFAYASKINCHIKNKTKTIFWQQHGNFIMPVPIVTFGIVILRASLRPVNKILMKQFENSRNNPIAYSFFTTIGYTSHRIDNFIN